MLAVALVNIALPVALSAGLRQLTAPRLQLVAFAICVILIFSLNQVSGLARRWLWPLQTVNIAAALFLGSLTAFSALPALGLLLRSVSGP